MIRKALDSDFKVISDDECAVRIYALKRAYGLDASFILYYSDDCGSLMSIMDGAAIVHCVDNVEEWAVFITMHPDIHHVHCSASFGETLANLGEWQGSTGDVLLYEGEIDTNVYNVSENPNLMSVHSLLCQCFPTMTSLNAWYPDVSHRLRHDCCIIATIFDGDKAVSSAMTVAETDRAAIIGQVATNSDYRGRGYAKICIKSLISRCKANRLYILPMTDIAHQIYTRMGFIPCGRWAELKRI